MKKLAQQRALISWITVSVLALLCCVLGFLQYRTVGQIAGAERMRLYGALQSKLNSAARAFDEDIARAISNEHSPLFLHIGRAVQRGDDLQLLLRDPSTGQFTETQWPPGWEGMRGELSTRMRFGGRGPRQFRQDLLFEVPRFGEPEQQWIVFELSADYLRQTVLPALVDKYLSDQGKLNFDVAVVQGRDGLKTLFKAGAEDVTPANADASVGLLGSDGRGGGGPPPGEARGRFGGPFGRGGGGIGGPPRVRLLARSSAGSLDALVRQSQRRNLATSASILALILVTVLVLLHFSRQAERFAQLQINFVAGVSHELRTPLTVIRTAAYNLRNARFRNQPDQVERYGRLIENESEKLEKLLEDVLRFASAKAGHPIRQREPVAANSMIEKALESSRISIEGTGVTLEEHIQQRLPVVLADGLALRHAVQNLLDNAIKYGSEGGNWIGVYADEFADSTGRGLQIRVADRGPGIPKEELTRLFDPFFRGRRAVQDQVHGTGLGLNLAKTIIEAHGGTLQVKSEPAGGTEFTVRIPAAPPEYQDEFAYSAD